MTGVSAEQSIEYLRRFGQDYEPFHPDVEEKLHDKTSVKLIGGAAVGKDSTMRAMAFIDPDFGKVRSFTDRGPRDDDVEGDYDYVGEDAEALERIVTAAMAGRLVQLVPPSTIPYIYGSELSAYDRPYMMLDAQFKAVDSLRKLPFKRHVEIGLVCEPDTWWERFQGRKFGSKDLAQSRIREGVDCIGWLLAQEDDVCWVDNSGKISKTASQVIDIARRIANPDPRSRDVGVRLQRAMVKMLG